MLVTYLSEIRGGHFLLIFPLSKFELLCILQPRCWDTHASDRMRWLSSNGTREKYDYHTSQALRMLHVTPIRHLVNPANLCKRCKPRTHSIVLVRLHGLYDRGGNSSSSETVGAAERARAKLAVMKVVRLSRSHPWTEPVALRDLMEHTHIAPRLLSHVVMVEFATLTVQAVLMQHLDGFKMASLRPLRLSHLSAAAEAVQTVQRLAWQHGDLHLGNILFDATRNMAFVIDWAMARNWTAEPRSNTSSRSCLLRSDAIALFPSDLDAMHNQSRSRFPDRASALAVARQSLPGALWALFDKPIQCTKHPQWRTVRRRCITYGCAPQQKVRVAHDTNRSVPGACLEPPGASCESRCSARIGCHYER